MISLPDMSAATDNQVTVRAPEGLEFAPSILVRRSRRLPTARPTTTLADVLTDDGVLELANVLARRRLDHLLDRVRRMSSWLLEVEAAAVEAALVDPESNAASAIAAQSLPVLRFGGVLHETETAIREARRALTDEKFAKGDLIGLEALVVSHEESLRNEGYRATFFADVDERPDVFTARLPPRENVEQSRNLDLRFHGRLRPSQRIYSSITLSTIVAGALTAIIAIHLLRNDLGADGAPDRTDVFVTLLVLVPAALFGGILTSARGGLAKELLRHWVTLFAVFGSGLSLALAVLIGTTAPIPTGGLWAILIAQALGFLTIARSSMIRRRHKGHLSAGRASMAISRVLRLPHPLDVVREALGGNSQTSKRVA